MSSKTPMWKRLLHYYLPFLFTTCRMGNWHWKWDKYCFCQLTINGVFYPVPLHPKSKKIANKNTVSFTCSDEALDIIWALKYLKFLGNIGSTSTIRIDGCKDDWMFDGDGSAQIGHIYVNNMEIK